MSPKLMLFLFMLKSNDSASPTPNFLELQMNMQFILRWSELLSIRLCIRCSFENTFLGIRAGFASVTFYCCISSCTDANPMKSLYISSEKLRTFFVLKLQYIKELQVVFILLQSGPLQELGRYLLFASLLLNNEKTNMSIDTCDLTQGKDVV